MNLKQSLHSIFSLEQLTSKPGIDSSLSKVPPVNPSPLPEIIGTLNKTVA